MTNSEIQKLAGMLPKKLEQDRIYLQGSYDPSWDYYDEFYRASSILVYEQEKREEIPSRSEFLQILRLAHPIFDEALTHQECQSIAEGVYDFHVGLNR